ncbi:hypothetical protein N7509_001921 [Penicillium cosmopolitanum]|uniref:3-hydroxyacyl-CoA dehydrogenase NAD binding domain-containing protein n=1 Tax=Penicillium cosmopolitanum TaxID=1131564 RepID=A0A9W9W849_9EURO|nr:uncharacterized protein N7509_001921 [Penicillium cosmopolitanum]KAJ5408038.1 hypothetical protein N7509_001921 [Penicillium cosmopolitanum]
MTSTSIKTVGVIGTGVIGASWTALFLAKGLRVIVTDPAPGAESKLHEYLKKNYLAIPNKIATPENYLQNLTFVEDIDPYLGELDLIQEVSKMASQEGVKKVLTTFQNGPERLDFKRRLFAHLDANTPEHVLIASSSSGLPSSELREKPISDIDWASFQPTALNTLSGDSSHPKTGDENVTAACEFYRSLGKDPVIVKKETAGFIANRLQAAVCAEAYSLISRGIVSAEDLGKGVLSAKLAQFDSNFMVLDKTMTSGLGLRWAFSGPIMTNLLGGGGDFGHFMDHLGPALKSWLDDMNQHQFNMDSTTEKENLKEKVNQLVSHVDIEKTEKNRDTFLTGLISVRSEI